MMHLNQTVDFVKGMLKKTVKVFLFKLSKNFPFQTVKIFPFQTVKKIPFQTVKIFPFQTVKKIPFQTVKNFQKSSNLLEKVQRCSKVELPTLKIFHLDTIFELPPIQKWNVTFLKNIIVIDLPLTSSKTPYQ
jgi:hypothetical protein